VRGCGYPLSPNVRPGQLPFIGPATANQINSILITGTCDELEGFRSDRIVSDSRGVPRYDSVGGRTRALFVALPGVGQRTAKLWWDLGCRSFEDVEAARVTGGPLANDGPNRLSLEQQFSLKHRHDLLQGTSKNSVC
jgi:DNA polymerase/3'-5' exonuclease PolX